MKRTILACIALILMGVGVIGARPVYAAGTGCGGSFLGFVPWYNGLTDSNCEIRTPNAATLPLSKFVWTIVGNISGDLLLAIGILCVGMIIYNGYLYILSAGDPAKAAKARKGLTAAIVGALIGLVGKAIVSFIVGVLVA